jgi:hypothetical protein
MVGTRAGTQAVLGARNTGPIGYIANGIAAVILGQLVGKGMKNQAAGRAVTLGGFLGVVARAIQEYTPFGQYVTGAFGTSGLGDWGIRGLGDYTPSTFFQPMQQQSSQWPAQVFPASITNAIAAAAPAPMRGLGARTAGARQDVTRF